MTTMIMTTITISIMMTTMMTFQIHIIERGRMDRDYSEEGGEDEHKSSYEAGFSENQGLMENQGYSEEGRTYAEERGYNADEQQGGGPYHDHRGNALMLQSNAAQSLQVSALILALVSFKDMLTHSFL